MLTTIALLLSTQLDSAAVAPPPAPGYRGRSAIFTTEPGPRGRPDQPWPGRALLLDAAGLAAPAALIAYGSNRNHRGVFVAGAALLVPSPAIGHLYGRLPRRALHGTVLRAVGFGLFAGGLSATGVWPKRGTSSDLTTSVLGGVLLALSGATIEIGSAAWDAITVADDVARHNVETAQLDLEIVPMALKTSTSPALALRARF